MKHFLSIIFLLCLSWKHVESVPAQVMIIRHAEKDPKMDSLSTKGRERAAAYVPFFLETKELLTFGTPIAIYAMQPAKADPSERPIQTVTALADALKLTLNRSYERDDYRRMVDEIMSHPAYNGKMVLICWEHTMIPQIARAFKAFQTPNRWQPEIYDRIWQINFGAAGKVTFQNIPQRLLYGDTTL